MMTRNEHVGWCKQRAREYLDRGELQEAACSMLSDLSKHPETEAVGRAMGPVAILYLMNRDAPGLRRWVEGFR